MKFKVQGVLLSLLFASGLCFLLNTEASGITAQEVRPSSEDDMREFLSKIVSYYDDGQIVERSREDFGKNVIAYSVFRRQTRVEGPYKHGDLYSIGINENGYITNHSAYPESFGYKFKPDASNSEVADTIGALINNSSVDTTACEKYGSEDRIACATKRITPFGKVTIIAGLLHKKDDPAIALPSCSENFNLQTKAVDVYNNPNEENLTAYVKDVIKASQQVLRDIVEELISQYSQQQLIALANDPVERAALRKKITEKIYDEIACFGTGDLKHRNIYPFIMSPNPPYTVLLNGNNFDLNGTPLQARDTELKTEDKTISGLFSRALTGGSGAPQVGQHATVEYRWDDPENPNDTIPDWFKDGLVPGNSPKTSYIEVVDINALIPQISPFLYIFGSGFYPMVEDDGGGCAIAGVKDTHQSALMNILLTASVLFSFVFLRKRA